MRVKRPDMTSGTVEILAAILHCPYCDAVFAGPDGFETIDRESYGRMPRTLVCLACMCRFVKPIPLGWGEHYTGAPLRPIERKRPDPGAGETRPGASQSSLAARTAIRRIDRALGVIRAARTIVRLP